MTSFPCFGLEYVKINSTGQIRKWGDVRCVGGSCPPNSNLLTFTLLFHPSNSILKTTRTVSIIRICILRVITYKNHYTLEMISLGKLYSSGSVAPPPPRSLLFFRANKQTVSGDMAVKQSTSGNMFVLQRGRASDRNNKKKNPILLKVQRAYSPPTTNHVYHLLSKLHSTEPNWWCVPSHLDISGTLSYVDSGFVVPSVGGEARMKQIYTSAA
jgi:hypothetical protein